MPSTHGIDELTRPVDAIKHQAKTVTVGISRSEDALFSVAPGQSAPSPPGPPPTPSATGPCAPSPLSTQAVAEVHRVHPLPDRLADSPEAPDHRGHRPWRHRRRAALPHRDAITGCCGTKHRAAEEREVTVARGASDGRTGDPGPRAKGSQVVGMTLLHVRFHERLACGRRQAGAVGYRTRYSALADAVTETEPFFDDERLGQEAVVDLLTEPVYELARRWRRPPA